MGLRKLNPIDSGNDSKIILMEEILSDGSKVYQIQVFNEDGGHVEIDCINDTSAGELFMLLVNQSNYLIK